MYTELKNNSVRAGRVSGDQRRVFKDYEKKVRKLEFGESKTIQLLNHLDLEPQLEGPIRIWTQYGTKYDRRSRRMLTTAGLQPLPKRLQHILSPGLHEWDIKAAQISLSIQIVDRSATQLTRKPKTQVSGHYLCLISVLHFRYCLQDVFREIVAAPFDSAFCFI
jgi:hypothetical protein